MKLYLGDCLEVMQDLEDNSIDTIITDPPYGLEFMGKDWDKGVPGVHFWNEMLRIAKPGACLMAMGGTRTYHRLASAIEDAGWRIIDMIEWLYGSGFPKSYDIGKGMDKAQGAEREVVGERVRPDGTTRPNAHNWSQKGMNEGWQRPWRDDPEIAKLNHSLTAPATPEAQLWDGWGTALKPAHEPICVAYKPRDGTFVNNALKWGVAGLNIDGGRVGTDEVITQGGDKFKGDGIYNKYATCEESAHQGRFPANVIHDGSDEVLRGFPETGNGNGKPTPANTKPTQADSKIYGFAKYPDMHTSGAHFNDSGSAARFFYCAKASRSERNAGLEERNVNKMGSFGNQENFDCPDGAHRVGNKGSAKMQNHHPTVKPIALMEYLVRLTKTPTGGVVLDPFMGSGTTGIACVNEGRDFIVIEQNEEYYEIAQRRIKYAEDNKQPVQPVLFGNNGHK